MMVEVDWDMLERPYADWLWVWHWLFSSLSRTVASVPICGWLLERAKRENSMPPMPLPMLAAPAETAQEITAR